MHHRGEPHVGEQRPSYLRVRILPAKLRDFATVTNVLHVRRKVTHAIRNSESGRPMKDLSRSESKIYVSKDYSFRRARHEGLLIIYHTLRNLLS